LQSPLGLPAEGRIDKARKTSQREMIGSAIRQGREVSDQDIAGSKL